MQTWQNTISVLCTASILASIGGLITMYTNGIRQQEQIKTLQTTAKEHDSDLRDGDRRLTAMEISIAKIMTNTDELLRRTIGRTP